MKDHKITGPRVHRRHVDKQPATPAVNVEGKPGESKVGEAKAKVDDQRTAGRDAALEVEHKKIVGDKGDEPIASGKKAGASTALLGLSTTSSTTHKRTFTAAVATALVGLALVFAPGPGHAADDGTSTAQGGSTTTQLSTGPPTSTAFPTVNGQGLTLPDLGSRTSVFEARLQSKQPQIDVAAKAALDRFSLRLEQVLRLNAAGAANNVWRGNPLDPASTTLTEAEQKELTRAFRDMVRELPVASLSPHGLEVVQDALRARGLPTDNIELMRIKDLGHAAGDIAKTLVDELRHEHPAKFYGTAVGVAAALGTYAAIDGSHVLRAVGVRPEVKTSFLDEKLELKVQADWDKRFSNPVIRTGIGTHFVAGGVDARLGGSVDFGGPTLSQMQATGFSLSGSAQRTWNDGASAFVVSGTTSFTGSGVLRNATLSGSYVDAPWTVTGSYVLDKENARSVGSLSVGYRVSKDVDLYGAISHESGQGTRDNGTTAMIGARLRF